MSIVSRPPYVWSFVFSLFAILAAPFAGAQAISGHPALEKQLSRLEVSANGIGVITKSVEGTNDLGVTLQQSASSTVGVLIGIRYTKSPYIGGEFNYSYARFSQRYREPVPGGGFLDPYNVGSVQTNTSEYSFGYVIHPPHQILGANPFASGGLGTTAFRPTTFGGLGLPTHARMTYYYSVGLEKNLNKHFGVRALFRQTFYKAPDLQQTYLNIDKQTSTIEPGFGFVIHF
ncbi:MAG TPA: outer membrane beta-barrel protein [Edaphobacter sp.]|jgi:hypothetical protein|nr:outer membrane beta-barrel protein [Edaphobacter sp.]